MTAGLVLLLATACISASSHAATPDGDENAVTLDASSDPPPETPPPDATRPVAEPPVAVLDSEAAWRIIIPEIGVNAAIVPIGLDPDGALGSPEGPFDVGWYSPGAVPGQRGNVLLDGHVDWTNRQTGVPFGAVFWSLARLSQGSPIYLNDGATEILYTVSEKLRFQWDDPAGAEVLQPTGDARLTLITCGGVFDRATRNYSMRDVVIAQLAN